MTFVGKMLMAASATALLAGMSMSSASAQYRRYGDDRYYDSGRSYGNRYDQRRYREDDDAYGDAGQSYGRRSDYRGSTTSQYGERRQDERYPQTTRGGVTDRRDPRWNWDD